MAVEGDEHHLRCVACSQQLGKPVLLQKTSLRRHVDSPKHTKALTWVSLNVPNATALATPEPYAPNHREPVPAQLHAVDEVMHADILLDVPMRAATPVPGPFEEAFFEDGMYVDFEGQAYGFSAGEPSSAAGARFNVRDALHLAEEAGLTKLDDVSSSGEAFEAVPEPDPELSAVAASLGAMGTYYSHSNTDVPSCRPITD